jgi:uncharacterized membrane protein YraQ (UPF0718 family)
MDRNRATGIGITAILMWALLALFTVGSAPVPPFLLSALCFGIGGGLALVWLMLGPGLTVLKDVPLYPLRSALRGCSVIIFFISAPCVSRPSPRPG